MHFNPSHARVAGVLYLLLVVVAPLRLVYIQNELFGDSAEATVALIAAHEDLFRMGILTDLFCATLEVFLTLALYRLFRPAGRAAAVIMAVLGLMPVPLFFVNVFNDFAIAYLVFDGGAGASLDATQVAGMVGLAAHLHESGVHMLQIFWAAWLFPLALLAWRSRIVPRVVAAWLGLNGGAYLALSLSGIAAPDAAASVALLAVPAQVGEVAFTASLLWWGWRGHRRSERMRSPAAATA